MALFKRQRDSSASVPIIGVVRFSVLMEEPAEFRVSKRTTFEERRTELFDPARLEDRFRIFEAVTLASALAQTDSDWTMLVIGSSEMPEPFRTRLRDLLAPHANVALAEMAPEQSLPDFVRTEIDRLHTGAARRAVFRLDDDDGLSRRFVAHLRQVITRWDKGDNIAFSFPFGHLIGVTGTSGQLLFRKVHHSFGIACGLTLLTDRGFAHGPFNLGVQHRMTDRLLPTVCETDGPAYVLISHGSNDTGENSVRWRQLRQGNPVTPDAVRRELGRDFAHLDLDALAH